MAFRAIYCLFLCIATVCFSGVFGVGGIEPINTENNKLNKGLKDALEYAMTKLNDQSNNIYQFRSMEVLDATQQVVQGMKYCVVATIGESKCRKGKGFDECSDEEKSIEPKMECHFEIWTRLWEDPMAINTLLELECINKKELESKGKLKCPGRNNKVKREVEEDVTYPTLPKKDEEVILAFNQFIEKYQKPYHEDETEFEYRYGVFKENVDLAQLMQDKDKGTARYGITQFSDLTKEEFLQNYTMNDWGEPLYEMQDAEIPDIMAPQSFDWRDHGAVSEVKDQGTCGSCWAFSTTGNIEGQWAIVKKRLFSLSEQELVDCDKVDQGCNGGLPSNAYKQIMALGGLESETEYPYSGQDGKCNFKKQDVDVYINGSVKISSDEKDMAAWLATNGPISIGINAMAMQFYLGGVAHPWEIFCNPSTLDHGVLIVGYGVKKSIFGTEVPYWIIKNSWGKSWGVQGYYLIYRGDGCCGLNTMCTSATID